MRCVFHSINGYGYTPLINVGTPKCVFDTLRKFGYSSFRPGQEEAIMNILSGKYKILKYIKFVCMII